MFIKSKRYICALLNIKKMRRDWIYKYMPLGSKLNINIPMFWQLFYSLNANKKDMKCLMSVYDCRPKYLKLKNDSITYINVDENFFKGCVDRVFDSLNYDINLYPPDVNENMIVQYLLKHYCKNKILLTLYFYFAKKNGFDVTL